MGKWGNGEMGKVGKWGNGKMGKWESGKVGKIRNQKSQINNHFCPWLYLHLYKNRSPIGYNEDKVHRSH
jgi:hypothetical protein